MPTVLQLTRSVVAPITRTRLFRAIAPVLLPPLEAVLGALSGGRLQLASLLVPSLVLHSVGARTGAARSVHLMYTPDGHGRAIVAGTSFARDRHPAWTYNLMAHPDAWITVRGRTLRVRASRVRGAERDAAWSRIEAQWPGYRGYERDSGRVVRLFVLRPVGELAAPPRDPAPAADGPLDGPPASD
ncbi:nitroreductase family deazaflavin-dependent oxidoreductase [Agromyces sp. SYSU T00266]|uniref:nitroreductase family deazaflavin-dependent oxidoreductase n=1 Tax=Agromyces zhanjiangensis TaxID=3158562 RepID=UPI003392505D